RTNFVDLDPTYKDIYGLPVPRVTYEPHAYEMAARMFYLPLMKQIVENAGVPAEKVFVTPTDQQQLAAPSSRHIMGTLRMGNDPATSVTSSDRPGKKLGQFTTSTTSSPATGVYSRRPPATTRPSPS